MQGQNFYANLKVINLGGCDVILGLDWMESHNPICFNLKSREVSMQLDEETVVLKAQKDDKSVTLLKGKRVQKLFKQGMKGASRHQLLMMAKTTHETIAPEILEVLAEFEGVFAEPKALPLQQNLDHQIPLKPHAKCINLRPYRYPYFQKTEVERLVKEMLETSRI